MYKPHDKADHDGVTWPWYNVSTEGMKNILRGLQSMSLQELVYIMQNVDAISWEAGALLQSRLKTDQPKDSE